MAKIKMTEEEIVQQYLNTKSREEKIQALLDEVELWDRDLLIENVQDNWRLSLNKLSIDQVNEEYRQDFLNYSHSMILYDYCDQNNITCPEWGDVDDEDNPAEKKCTCGALKGGGTHSSWCDIL